MKIRWHLAHKSQKQTIASHIDKMGLWLSFPSIKRKTTFSAHRSHHSILRMLCNFNWLSAASLRTFHAICHTVTGDSCQFVSLSVCQWFHSPDPLCVYCLYIVCVCVCVYLFPVSFFFTLKYFGQIVTCTQSSAFSSWDIHSVEMPLCAAYW